MAEEITATLVVRFGEFVSSSDSENGLLVMEVDTRFNGLNDGRTTFFAGQNIGFLVHRTTNISIPVIKSNVGNARFQGAATEEITEILIFSNSDTASLSKPAQGGVAHVWLGSSGGSITIENQKNITLNEKFTGVLEVTYTTGFRQYLLEGTPGEINGSANYTIVISAVGEVLV